MEASLSLPSDAPPSPPPEPPAGPEGAAAGQGVRAGRRGGRILSLGDWLDDIPQLPSPRAFLDLRAQQRQQPSGSGDGSAEPSHVPAPAAAAEAGVGSVPATQLSGSPLHDAGEEVAKLISQTDLRPSEPRFDLIVSLLKSIFGVYTATVSLAAASVVGFHDQSGELVDCGKPAGSLCDWFTSGGTAAGRPGGVHKMQIVEDTHQDARFKDSAFVTKPPYIRYYAGAPLVGTDSGCHYGTLYLLDTAPRSFSAEEYAILVHFAELVTRQLEQDKALNWHQQALEAARQAAQHAQRARHAERMSMLHVMDCFEEGVMLCHPSGPHWRVLYANDAWCRATGVGREEALGSPGFWQLFRMVSGDESLLELPLPLAEEGESRAQQACGPGREHPVAAIAAAAAAAGGAAGMAGAAEPEGAAEAEAEAYVQAAVDARQPFRVRVMPRTGAGAGAGPFAALWVEFKPSGAEQQLQDSSPPMGTSAFAGAPSGDAISGAPADAEHGGTSESDSSGDPQQYYFGIIPLQGPRLGSPGPSSAFATPHGTPLGAQRVAWAAAAAGSPGSLGAGAGGACGSSSAVSRGGSLARAVSWEKAKGVSGLRTPSGGTPHSMASSRRGTAHRTPGGMPSFKLLRPKELEDVTLGPMIGSGSFGRCYRGTWHGANVAVKILDCWTYPRGQGSGQQGPGEDLPTDAEVEALLSRSLAHPYIVTTFDFAIAQQAPGEGPDPEKAMAGMVHQQVWILQQYCSKGTLMDCIERGLLFRADGSPNLFAILQTASEIAGGMDYLHRQGLLHGDLTPNNVLLSSSVKDTRRWIAQVADFGLAQAVKRGEAIVTETLGTVTHMPPELLLHGTLSPAADVYSFGVILWEMWAGRHAWEGRTALQIMHAVCIKREALPPHADAPPQLQNLIQRCLDSDPSQRPSFEEVLTHLGDQLRPLRPDRHGSLNPTAQASGGSLPGMRPALSLDLPCGRDRAGGAARQVSSMDAIRGGGHGTAGGGGGRGGAPAHPALEALAPGGRPSGDLFTLTTAAQRLSLDGPRPAPPPHSE